MARNNEKFDTVGEQRDIIVTINHSTPEEYTIEFVQQIESQLDKALAHIGFSRSKTTKGKDKIEFVYYQFAFAMRK